MNVKGQINMLIVMNNDFGGKNGNGDNDEGTCSLGATSRSYLDRILSGL